MSKLDSAIRRGELIAQYEDLALITLTFPNDLLVAISRKS